ncbi:flagellar hook-basal body complex protein FliE [Bosea sp. 124]|uniref:flagellar hook-basal body complex protein FliE n=1 Tax=Bosea sp. 124 TaxID=2135642 RepID=UPI000D380693|nr:flagellar hook-basal body complex protein FliE [Bosea sp. 124]PTM40686.1 flagellar hook-basal body complex protein FliE [Bosea sp. 124]
MLNAISALAPVASQVTQGLQNISASGIRPGLGAEAAAASPGADFGSVFAGVAQNFVDNLQQGEAQAVAGVQGKAAVQDVVQAVMSAEQSLQLAMAMRDKVVAAYQEFIHMAI